MPRHRCPKCQRGDCFYQDVVLSGYIEVDEELEHQGSPEQDHAWWEENENTFGCSCGWHGQRKALIVLGIDDEELPVIHPDQLALVFRLVI